MNTEKKTTENKTSFFQRISNFFKSKERKKLEEENKRMVEELEILKKQNETSKFEKVENKANEITGDIWEKISELSDNANSSIFKGVNIANDEGNKLIEKIKTQVDKYDSQAKGLKLEEVLSQNFNESLFIKAVLDGMVNFSFKGERKIYDFMEHKGTKYVWKSDWEYFEFTLLKNLDKTAEYIFKINHIDVKVLRIFVNYELLYNVIVHKKHTN
jgi:hypothetical protein